ncbi:SMP-30/gluconolactonase/LRE family protein [Glycomyces halotolerans]
MLNQLTKVSLSALSAVALLAAASPAAAGWGRYDPAPEVIEAASPTHYPEGVAYDSGRDAFLVTSLVHGTVSVVGRDGEVSTLIDHPALVSTIGVRVDARRDRVLVATADHGVAHNSTPETVGDLAGLGIFDLDSGELIEFVDLGALAPEAPGHFANDIAIGWDGTAYVTDSIAGIVFEVALDGSAKVLVQDERLQSPDHGFGVNGVAVRFGDLIVGNADSGTLWRIDLDEPEALREIEVEANLIGVDGLVWKSTGSLVAVTNSLGQPGTDAVWQLRLTHGGTKARVVEERAWPDRWPTTATQRGCAVYVLSGNMGVLMTGQEPTDEFTIRRF